MAMTERCERAGPRGPLLQCAMLLPAVELRALTKLYREGDGERAVLRDASATFWLGEIVVLVGRSGSGKSTLLNLISGIDRPTAGTVLVNGTDLTGLDERARTLFRREHIGFIFQFFNLVPLLTVEENLLLPLELLGRADAAGRARARELLDRVGLADRARAYPDRLSGGEQQRLAVARALVHDPVIVLADEPTGNLDAETAKVVLSLLDQLVRELGKTVVMATHSSEVVGTADRLFLVQHGQLVEQWGAAER
jgi:putative ABC transport system ATP-binding protein